MSELSRAMKGTAAAYAVIFLVGHVLGNLEKEVETTRLQPELSTIESELPAVEGNSINLNEERDMSAKLLADPKVAALVEKEVAKAVKAERKRCLDEVKAYQKAAGESVKSLCAEIKDPAPFDTDSDE